MTARERALTIAAAALGVALLAGCGGSGGTDTSSSASSPATAAPTSMPDEQAPPEQLVIDVRIQGGSVEPSNAQLRAAIGAPIVIHVDSDSVDELHVHSTPEHSFDIAVGPAQTFQFTVDMPGRVDIELHDLNKTIATVQVQ